MSKSVQQRLCDPEMDPATSLFLKVCLSSNCYNAINNYCVLFLSFNSCDRPTELWCLWEDQLQTVSLKCCSEKGYELHSASTARRTLESDFNDVSDLIMISAIHADM